MASIWGRGSEVVSTGKSLARRTKKVKNLQDLALREREQLIRKTGNEHGEKGERGGATDPD